MSNQDRYQQTNEPELEIHIVCSDRLSFLVDCMTSVRVAAHRANIRARIRVLLNAPPVDLDIQKLLVDSDTHVTVHRGLRLRPGQARNVLLEDIRAPWVFFIDDDACADKDLLLRFNQLLTERPRLVMVGGPNVTPRGSTPFQMGTGAVLESCWGTLQTRARYSPVGQGRPAREAMLSSCNLFVRREILERIRYPDDYRTAEESHFFLRVLAEFSEQSWYAPDLIVFHQRRCGIKAFVRQIRGYAEGRAQLVTDGKIESLWHFVPSVALLLSVAISLYPLGRLVLEWLMMAYFAMTFVAVGFVGLRLGSARAAFWSAIGFLLVHLSYALGFLTGLVKFSLAQKPSYMPVQH